MYRIWISLISQNLLFNTEIVARHRSLTTRCCTRSEITNGGRNFLSIVFAERNCISPGSSKEMRYWKAATRWKLCWKHHLIYVLLRGVCVCVRAPARACKEYVEKMCNSCDNSVHFPSLASKVSRELNGDQSTSSFSLHNPQNYH